VTECQDYSRQLYGIGESWNSQYAKLTCMATGVVSQRGKTTLQRTVNLFAASHEHDCVSFYTISVVLLAVTKQSSDV